MRESASEILERICEDFPDEPILKADGLDQAIIGYCYTSHRLIYSVSNIIDLLMEDMDYESAIEHFSFNIAGAYVGEYTPIYCWDL